MSCYQLNIAITIPPKVNVSFEKELSVNSHLNIIVNSMENSLQNGC